MKIEEKNEFIIKVDNLCRSYITYKRGSGFNEAVKSFIKREKINVEAVSNITFNVKKGDIVGILGPNGAGKSTTIKMLTGTLYKTSGTIEVMGYNPTKNRKDYVKNIGAVFGQKSQLIFDIPPIDSFRMNKAIYGISDELYNKNLEKLVTLLEVKEIIFRPTRVLSLGERMKCEFIMAMLHSPAIVFLDEPTIGLDVIAKQNIRNFIKEMNKEGVTFILTTHDLEDVEKLVNNVIIINEGKKVFDGKLDSLKKKLGNKKVVEITLDDKSFFEQIKNSFVEGSRVVKRINEYKLLMEVDMNIISISDFILRLLEKCTFSDISIKEISMEEIITNIYKS